MTAGWARTGVVTLMVLMVGGAGLAGAAQRLEAKLAGAEVVIRVEAKLFTCYKFGAGQKYPYFWPVNGPASGRSVTTETSQPYPHHH